VAQAKPAAAAPSASAPKTAVARAAPPAPQKLPPTVMMQQIPTDPKAGPVKVATGAPRKLATPPAAAPKQAVAKKEPAAPAPVKTAAQPQPKKTAEAEKAAKTKTPALRMTADAGSP
jgi:hypothetical protein